jgi:hypothetical protein
MSPATAVAAPAFIQEDRLVVPIENADPARSLYSLRFFLVLRSSRHVKLWVLTEELE